ncbi:MAG: hypothetical protein GX496_05015, partial [Firmicutes bacterium]|nr:hypothetical protein [Bacillota bacterium]
PARSTRWPRSERLIGGRAPAGQASPGRAAPISSALFRMGRSAPRRLPAAARAAGASAAGVAVIYALGVTQLAAVTGLPWMRALARGAGPFVAADLAKAVAACLAAPYVERAVTGAEVRPAPSRGASGRPA